MASNVAVRLAQPRDIPWLADLDRHLGSEQLAAKVAAREVFIAEVEGEPVGLMRIDHLWSTAPFIALIRVQESQRRRGVGRALVETLCHDAPTRNAGFILSSTTGGEAEPLAWHKAVGFVECGQIRGIDGPGSVEVILRRDV